MRVSSHSAVQVYRRPPLATAAVVHRDERSEPAAKTPVGAPDSPTEVSLSPAAKEMAAHLEEAGADHDASSCPSCSAMLSESDQKKVAEMKQRDAEVRRHEQAHLAAAGPHAAGGPFYEYEKGPDGRQYVVAGHVNIDTAPVEGDPQATLEKAETIRRAALAPAEPSAQDRRVASKASAMAAKARRELASERGSALVTPTRAVSSYEDAS